MARKSKPAADKSASAAAKKAPVRRSPIERALHLATVLDKAAQKLYPLVANWRGEASIDQAETNQDTVACLKTAAELSPRILLNLDMLQKTHFAPQAGSSSTIPLAAGERVTLKDKFYIPAVHGSRNEFEVVVAIDKHVRVKTADPKAPQFVVLRAWLEVLDVPEVEDDADTASPEDTDIPE
jgi:hypothetical protein